MVDGDGTIRIVLTTVPAPTDPTGNNNEMWTPSEVLRRHLKRTESG